METIPKDPYASQKKYYQKHRETIISYFKDKYHSNRDEVVAVRRQKFDCELCGGRYTYDHRSHHFNSKMHKLALSKATEKISNIALSIADIQGIDKREMERQVDTLNKLSSIIKKTTPRNPKYIDFNSAFSEES